MVDPDRRILLQNLRDQNRLKLEYYKPITIQVPFIVSRFIDPRIPHNLHGY